MVVSWIDNSLRFLLSSFTKLVCAQRKVTSLIYWFLTLCRARKIEKSVNRVEEKAKGMKDTVKEKLTESLPDVIPHVLF
jgi:hypothetical protein